MTSDTVSWYKGSLDPTVKGESTWQAAMSAVASGKYREIIAEARSIRTTQGEDAYREFKKTLPAVTFGGTFAGQRSKTTILNATGYIVADLDHLQDVEETFSHVAADENTWFAFRSPSGDGIKVGLRADGIHNDDDHKGLFVSVERYFREVYGLRIDPACKDICRLTFLSDDPGAYVNPSPFLFDIDLWAKTPEAPPTETKAPPRMEGAGKAKYAQRVIEGCCKDIRESLPGQQHHTRLRMGRLAGGYAHYLTDSAVLADLEQAVRESGAKNMGAAMKTIHDAFDMGKASPITIPDFEREAGPRTGGQSPNASQADEWEPDIRPWPRLSKEAMPGIVGTFVELATKESEADPAAVLVTFLTRFGVEAYGAKPGKGPVLYVGETRHYSRLFAAVVGNSSKARKGTSAKPVEVLFDFSAVPAALSSAYIPASTSAGPLSTGEGLAFSVRDARQEWVVDKRTKAGEWSTVDPGVEDKRLFLCDEEFAAALQCTKREGNTLSTAMRCFWDSGDYSPLVKRERTKATGAHVGIVTHITFRELAGLLDDVQAFNGFGNRFLWVCARRQKKVPFPGRMPEAELSAIRHDLFNAVLLAHDCGVVSLDARAREMWGAVYSDLSQDHPGLSGCIINRGEAQALRLALVYALLDGQAMIGEPHLRAGLAFWDYCRASALYVFGGRESDPIADKILAALKDGPKTTTMLHRAMGNNATKDKIKAALQSLLASGRIIQTEEKTASKPRKNYSLNEQYEFNEFSPGVCPGAGPAEEDNSDNSDNSSGGEKNSELWTGPAEVEI